MINLKSSACRYAYASCRIVPVRHADISSPPTEFSIKAIVLSSSPCSPCRDRHMPIVPVRRADIFPRLADQSQSIPLPLVPPCSPPRCDHRIPIVPVRRANIFSRLADHSQLSFSSHLVLHHVAIAVRLLFCASYRYFLNLLIILNSPLVVTLFSTRRDRRMPIVPVRRADQLTDHSSLFFSCRLVLPPYRDRRMTLPILSGRFLQLLVL